MTELPDVLAEIEEAAGREAALAIAEARAGTRVFIPPKADGSWLVETVGLESARKIVAHFRILTPSGRELGYQAVIPLAGAGVLHRARRRLIEALKAGKTPAEAALVAGLHERTAYRMAAKLRGAWKDPRQGELF